MIKGNSRKKITYLRRGEKKVSRGMGSENNRMGSRDDRNPVVLAKLSFSKTSQQEQQLGTQTTGRAKNHASPPYCTSIKISTKRPGLSYLGNDAITCYN